MNNLVKQLVICSTVALSLVVADMKAYAGITTNLKGDTILVTDFPKDRPATPADIKAADEKNAWEMVDYDLKTDTYVIKANLKIGAADTTSTWFQLGTKEHPKETLVMAGQLAVMRPAKDGGSNMLQLGRAGSRAITPALKIVPTGKKEISIYIFEGAGFNAFHATISSANPGKGNMASRPWLGGRIVWEDCHISWFPVATYRAYNDVFKRCTFSHCGMVFMGPNPNTVEDCNFIDSAVGIGAVGATGRGTFRNCLFKNNMVNVNMGHGAQVVLIDPQINPAKSRSSSVGNSMFQGKLRRGRITVKRSMVIEIVNAEGNPVEAALVDVTNEMKGGPAPENGATATDEDGRTPDRYSDPVIVTDYIQTAVKGEDGIKRWTGTPITTPYTYQMKVTKEGYKNRIVEKIDPSASWSGKGAALKVVLCK